MLKDLSSDNLAKRSSKELAPGSDLDVQAPKSSTPLQTGAKPSSQFAPQNETSASIRSPKTGATATQTIKNHLGESAILVLQEGDISEDASLDALAYDLSELEDEPWQKRLEDMMLFMGTAPQALQREIPSLALLTSQLQNIEPESIPTVLAESPLIQNLMASADSEAVVEQIKPLGLWLDEMGWAPEGLVIKDPIAFQDLMNTPVTLKDVMETLQVDVDRVLKEADILRETLPMDGASPYIVRALRIQAEARPVSVPEKLKNLSEGAEIEGRDLEMLALLGGSTLGREPQTLVKDQAVPSKGADIQAKPAATIGELIASMVSPAPLAPSPDGFLIGPRSENLFQKMEMTSGETFRFDEEGLDTSPTFRENRQNWLENLQASQLQTDLIETKAVEPTYGTFDSEALSPQLAEVLTPEASGFSTDQESSEDLHDEREAGTSSSPAFVGQTKAQNPFEVDGTETPKTQRSYPEQKAVFEKTQMLVKEGGGAMRIDIGNKDTGPIDLAVEVNNGKVEVKISADSPEARQLLAQDLPRLRESLQNQNLNLSKVEIGLFGGSSWTSADGRSSREESSQSSQTEEISSVSSHSTRKTARSYSRVSSTSDFQPGATREGGGIKVRV
jgi:flagellar hook-length control protein FliK